MIENGEITEPVRAAQLIGNGPETLLGVDAVGNDFDTWAGTCGKDGQGVPVSSGQPTLRVRRAHRAAGPRRLSGGDGSGATCSDDRRGGRRARSRACARASRSRRTSLRTRDTDVKVFDGEVESLSVAEVDGVGVRVLVDHAPGLRVGRFARAGRRGRDGRRSARQRGRSARPTSALGLPEPADVAGVDRCRRSTCGATSCSRVPTDEKVALALEVERGDARAPTRGCAASSRRTYGDGAVEVAVASSLGVEASARRTVCSVASFALAGEGEETQTGYGFSVGRTIGGSRRRARRHATPAERSTRLLGARAAGVAPAPGGARSAGHPVVPRRCSARRSAARRCSRAGRCSSAGSGEEVGAPRASRWSTTRRSPRRSARRRTTAKACRPAAIDLDRRRRAPGVPAQRVHGAPLRRRARPGSAVRGGSSRRPAVGARALHLDARARSRRSEILAAVPEALYVQSVSGLHSGTNPVSGDFSVGAEGLMVRDGAFAEPVREITIASTLQRMLLDVAEVGRRPHLAPRRRRRRHPAARRHDDERRAELDSRAAASGGRGVRRGVEDRVELGDRGERVLAEVHGLHAECPRRGDVLGVVVDEHRRRRARRRRCSQVSR